MKRAHDSQIVRAEENLKLNLGVPNYRWASGTNPPIKALRRSRKRDWTLTHGRAIKEETIAINSDCVTACHQSNIQPLYNVC